MCISLAKSALLFSTCIANTAFLLVTSINPTPHALLILFPSQIKAAPNDLELRELLLQDSFKFVSECDFMRPITLKLCDVSAIVKQVCMEYVLMRSSLEMDQFYRGLETLGIGYLV